MRDRRGRSPSPKPIGAALESYRQAVAPETPLAAVQSVWETVVGERIAAVTEVVAEREGVVTIECSSAVWAEELGMMGPQILKRLGERLAGDGPEKLRFLAAS